MLTTELIKVLQKLVNDHKPHEEVMGPHEIMIDVFGNYNGEKGRFYYAGFSPKITIQKSLDGVYDILNAFAEGK